jgi:hypothetical protein
MLYRPYIYSFFVPSAECRKVTVHSIFFLS